MTIQMKALRPFVYAGKRLKVGDLFRAQGTMRPGSQPALLQAIGHAEPCAPAVPVVVAPLRAQYQTRVMTPAAPVVAAPATAPEFVIKHDGADMVLDGMTAAELHALAKEMGVSVHHAAGARKVSQALVEAQAE